MEQEVIEMLYEGFSIDYILEILNPDDDENLTDEIWSIYEHIMYD